MEHEVKLPELGEDAGDEATVSFFHFEEGDEIKEGDALVEMVTDKAAFDVPCPVSGVLKKILAEEDQIVQVGGALAIIETKE